MSETWVSLLSGVVGAIVGGVASLAGTMVVNKRQMAVNARMRLYDELLPRLAPALDDLVGLRDTSALKRVPEGLAAVRRASAIAGRKERRFAHNLALLWSSWESTWTSSGDALPMELPVAVSADPPESPRERFAPGSLGERRLKREKVRGQMKEEVLAFSDYLGAKLG